MEKRRRSTWMETVRRRRPPPPPPVEDEDDGEGEEDGGDGEGGAEGAEAHGGKSRKLASRGRNSVKDRAKVERREKRRESRGEWAGRLGQAPHNGYGCGRSGQPGASPARVIRTGCQSGYPFDGLQSSRVGGVVQCSTSDPRGAADALKFELGELGCVCGTRGSSSSDLPCLSYACPQARPRPRTATSWAARRARVGWGRGRGTCPDERAAGRAEGASWSETCIGKAACAVLAPGKLRPPAFGRLWWRSAETSRAAHSGAFLMSYSTTSWFTGTSAC
jgi:hypothetical protein